MKRLLAAFTFLAAFILPAAAQACATCFGAADDPQTEGRNAAILTLMVTTYTLFFAMATAAFFLWRRGRKLTVDLELAAEGAEADRG